MEMEETVDADNLTLLVTSNVTCMFSASDTACHNDTWISDLNDTCVLRNNKTDACIKDGEESDYLYKVRSYTWNARGH